MKILLSICAGIVMALSAVTASASDVTGSWIAEMTAPDGNSFQISFTFKQDGAKLTGSVQGPQGDAIAISDGKIDGNKISFNGLVQRMRSSTRGPSARAGDEIKLTSKSDSGDFPANEVTLKRVKAPPASASVQP